MATNTKRKRREYDPKHQYDDTALMAWLERLEKDNPPLNPKKKDLKK